LQLRLPPVRINSMLDFAGSLKDWQKFCYLATMRPLMIFFSLLGLMLGEGTRELMANNCSNHGYIQIWDNNDPLRNFATYDCPEYARLYIRVAAGERIYMGFHVNGGPDNNPTIYNDVWMRLRDPNGNIVMGPLRLHDAMGAGWITSCAQAMAGPQPLVGATGYNPLFYDVPAGGPSGDYYIEFAVNNDPNIRQKRVFRWFDITVARWSGTSWVVKPGRLWSRKWDFTTRGQNNPFVGTLYTYSPDSVVTSFDFNGMRPYGFEVACNSFGASTVGTPQQRRRSDYRQNIINAGGIPAAPEYPIFLNDPDIEYYPTGIVGSVDSFAVIPCTEMSYCIYVSLSKPGQVQITLNFPAPYVPWTFVGLLNAGPNCVPWDGRDGNGTPVSDGTVVNAQLDYFTGLTHLPLVDVEHHNNGFRVFLVRPTTKPDGSPIPDPKVYWDDILLTDPGNSLDGVQNLTGCQPTLTLGCHRWRNRGTNNANPEVINTWWYTNTEQHTFVLNVDPAQWKVFAEIPPASCSSENGVTVHLWFSSDIPLSSVIGNISTTPSGLLGSPPDTVIDNTSQPGWTHLYITYPVNGNANNVLITYEVVASSSRYPYCRDTAQLSCLVLPVVWARELWGEALATHNRLFWQVAQEPSHTTFIVERRDGALFVPIGSVMGRGSSAAYTFEDYLRPGNGPWYYRLRIEVPGAAPVYSRTVELTLADLPLQVKFYQGTLYISGSEPTYAVEVYNALGQLLWSSVLAPGAHELPIPPGFYVVRVGEQVLRIAW